MPAVELKGPNLLSKFSWVFVLSCMAMLAACGTPTEKHMKKADRLREMGRFPEAVKEFEAAIETDPDNISAHYKLASLYRESLNDKDKAIEHLQRVVELDPQYAKAWEKMAVLYDKKHDQTAVIRTLENSLKANAFHDKPEKKIEVEEWLAELKMASEEPLDGNITTSRPSLRDLPGD